MPLERIATGHDHDGRTRERRDLIDQCLGQFVVQFERVGICLCGRAAVFTDEVARLCHLVVEHQGAVRKVVFRVVHGFFARQSTVVKRVRLAVR